MDWQTGEPEKRLIAIAHWDDAGEIDGYVTYKTADGAVKIIDFTAVNEQASVALWAFLSGFDLIKRIEFPRARVDEIFPWLLADPRRYHVKSRVDALWLRVLDPAKALVARDYLVDDTLTLKVNDELGFAAGTWQLSVQDSRAICTPTDAKPDLELDVRALGAALLGSSSPAALASAGLIRGENSTIRRLATLLSVERQPYCIFVF